MTRAKCVASLFQRSIRVSGSGVVATFASFCVLLATNFACCYQSDEESQAIIQEIRTILQVADSPKHSIRANRAAEALAAAAKRAAEALTIACVPQSVPTDSNCGQASAGTYPAALRAHHTSKSTNFASVATFRLNSLFVW